MWVWLLKKYVIMCVVVKKVCGYVWLLKKYVIMYVVVKKLNLIQLQRIFYKHYE
jgi:hypothetical protein